MAAKVVIAGKYTSRSLGRLLRENPASTYENFMNTLGIGYSSVYERVKFLKQKGILSREGGLYGGKWVINEALYFQLYPSSETTR